MAAPVDDYRKLPNTAPRRRLPRLLVAVAALVLLGTALVLFEATIVPVTVQRLRRSIDCSNRFESLPPSGSDYSYELMEPQLIAEIARRPVEPSPIQAHLVWIGDLATAPATMHNYTAMGFALTVHTSVEEILDGFHPYVLRAFKLAVPNVVGFDFLKLLLLYKYGGIAADADTTPAVNASAIEFPRGCDVIFGKETHMPYEWFEKPLYRHDGVGQKYPFNRPFQVLNWAMMAAAPRNPHVKRLIEMAMMHFFGLRDMEFKFIQDVAGSGLMTDYVALLHEREGRSYEKVYKNREKLFPVQGMCLTDGYLTGYWIRHEFIGTWKQG